MRTSYYRKDNQYAAARSVELDPPTNDTAALIPIALSLAEQAFKPGYEYLKAKVIATELIPVDAVQGDLFFYTGGPRKARPPDANRRFPQTAPFGPDLVKFGALGLKPTWTMAGRLLF